MSEGLNEYEGLPEALARKLVGMTKWNNKILWKTARYIHLTKKESAKLQALQHKREFKPLTQAEVELKDKLLEKYENSVLIRAEAVLLLKQRGFDISVLRKIK